MNQNGTRLDGWKAIAAYLNKEVRTVIRWEKERQLPVHRIPGEKRSAVFSWTSEIDAWLKGSVMADGGNGTAADVEMTPSGKPVVSSPTQPQSRKGRVIAAIAVAFLGIAVGHFRLWPRPIEPHLGIASQITSDGREKDDLVGGADSIFFDSWVGANETITRIADDGDRQSLVPFEQHHFALLEVSPDRSELLIVAGGFRGFTGPLWIVGTGGGPPQRLADLSATTAAWSPDGRKFAYVRLRTLYLARPDGAESRAVLTLPFKGEELRWSPDGKRLLLILAESSGRLWQVSLDDLAAKPLLPEWSRMDGDFEAAGRWTPDGRYFVFAARHNGISGLWAIRESDGWRPWRNYEPVQLTTSLNGVSAPLVRADGKKLFAIVTAPEAGDLMRYDLVARRFAAYPDQLGLSAAQTAFSPDGKLIAYVTHPQICLWKMNADGTNRKMLTDQAIMPQWSPDGRSIAYMESTRDTGKPTKIRIISANGGRSEQPVTFPEWQGIPTWTADGKGLIFGENGPTFPISAACAIHLFDLKSGKASELPGSTGLWTARASPTGRYIAAVTRDDQKLVLYDQRTKSWKELLSFADSQIGANPAWSRDGKFIYVDAPDSPDPFIWRIAVLGGHPERVASLKGIQRVHGTIGLWMGLTPDNVPLILRAVQSRELWAWDWISPK